MNELNYKKRFHLFKDMKFLHRMILIYLIGGIIPLLVMSIYTNMQTRKMMIKLTEETQAEELSVLSSSIRESMAVLDNVARLLCDNDEILKIANRNYKNKTQFYSDYRKANMVMEDYINFYEQDISSINLFLDNPTVDTYDLNRINNLSYFKQSVRTQTWYKETVDCVDEGYWYFGETSGDNEKDQTMQISRAVRDDDDDVVGIVVIQIQYDKVTLNEQRQDTAILYDDYYWISGNCSSLDYPFLKEEIQKINKSRVTKQISYGVEEYLISYERLQMDGSDDYYSVVSVQNYQDIMAEVNQISMQAFIPEIIGMIVSALLIFAFAASYSNRMFQLRVQMHRVAQGEYDEVERIEGNDEIGELYTELEQMMQDIRSHIGDPTDKSEVEAYLRKLLDGEVFDRKGLIYGMGHAVYSISDPRERVLKSYVQKLAEAKGKTTDMALYSNIEEIAPQLIAEKRRIYKGVSPNVDFYSGFVYDMLGIPVELYTPLFAIARVVGWSAHRIEELVGMGKIIRPAYKSVMEEIK